METKEPIYVIPSVNEVDDAGGTHYECVLTGEQILDLLDRDLLKFEGNIRPDWQDKMKAKTRRKVYNWAAELLDGEAVIGNLSIRIDPSDRDIDFEFKNSTFYLYSGYFDTGVDSQSRITSIKIAGENIAQMNPHVIPLHEQRFAVRIWSVDDANARRVGSKFNTEGDKVNETAAKWAHSEEFTTDDLANRLARFSPHLKNNVEILSNSVSASSAKIFAFNTLAKAFENHWVEIPATPAQRDKQVEFLVEFWDALVEVRKEFGLVPIDQRKAIRGSSLAGTALSIYGIVAIAARLWSDGGGFSGLQHLSSPARTGNGGEVDYFSYNNSIWKDMGVLVSTVTASGDPRLSVRNSFQSRKAVAGAMLQKVGF